MPLPEDDHVMAERMNLYFRGLKVPPSVMAKELARVTCQFGALLPRDEDIDEDDEEQ